MIERPPVAIDKTKVGSYPARAFAGGGYFFDDVLEYRVWVCPPEGGDDYYQAFATYEEALAYGWANRVRMNQSCWFASMNGSSRRALATLSARAVNGSPSGASSGLAMGSACLGVLRSFWRRRSIEPRRRPAKVAWR